ncbi:MULTISPECIES: hypothetical protein [unclassified Phyllobacterium]|uniref:hypothetical protein n=1 Tax=unclassified Phyllobacterium TaxID=2638441 RepID=UPI003012FB3E
MAKQKSDFIVTEKSSLTVIMALNWIYRFFVQLLVSMILLAAIFGGQIAILMIIADRPPM